MLVGLLFSLLALNETRWFTHSEWDAKSATKPLDGVYAVRKPNITCFFQTPDGTSTHTWEHVVTFCEVKTQADSKREKESFVELAGKASCLLGAQDGHLSVSCIRILGSSIYSQPSTIAGRSQPVLLTSILRHSNSYTF